MDNGLPKIEPAVWLLGAYSPKFHVIGIFTSKQKATDILETLPKQGSYVLFEAPLDEFFGFVDKDGQVKDGMGRLRHDHFAPEE